MRSILAIPVQKLFIVTILLKVISSFFGWFLKDPWILGFAVPLSVMLAYILIGLKRQDREVSDEKFADTCYYLGFIFTITSIIFSLFDLPNIGTQIQNIAVRFGAAMVSTVAGLVVRVYLVSFKWDVGDVIQDAEAGIIEASHKFRMQLLIAFEKLCDFQSEVDTAAKATVERINMQVESLSKNHAEKLTEFFAELTKGNREVFTNALEEVKGASLRLSQSVDDYSLGMRASLTSIESKVMDFSDAVTTRLAATTFPDDYFAKNLAAPLFQLSESASAISSGVKAAAGKVNESTAMLSTALKSLRSKATNAETSLDRVVSLTAQQQLVLDQAQGQLNVLGELSGTLGHFETTLTGVLNGLIRSNKIMTALYGKVDAILTDGTRSTKILEDGLKGVTNGLGINASAATDLLGKFDRLIASDSEAAKTLGELVQHATTAVDRVNQAVQQLQGMARQLASLDVSLRTQRNELRKVAERIKDVKVTVDFPSVPSVVPPLAVLANENTDIIVSVASTPVNTPAQQPSFGG